ncbi:MAG: 4'-phosphopantetheinyl transferase superfamily protein, partial [Thermodesulfobacteriota bacterium]|nr:4'-phosphopantetheinyl transferase superfamily protein [Thermodesulfobacteriota bacterium]
LEEDDVHVWRAYLDPSLPYLRHLKRVLSPDEVRRAERFRFEKDRQGFVIAHGVLRKILSLYVRIAPSELVFRYNVQGKPALDRQSNGDDLRFNLSHSDGMALYAITRGREIGIDVEQMRTDFKGDAIAARFFSPQEVAMLRALPRDAHIQGFFACWTRKEAYVKARGDGLSFPLDQCGVSVAPEGPAALLHTQGDRSETWRWSLKDLTPGPGYAAALAVEGGGWLLKCWQWPESWNMEPTT